jgi:4-amino-4-deoxy-L-arabinose transferase-like glycosyltransferase
MDWRWCSPRGGTSGTDTVRSRGLLAFLLALAVLPYFVGLGASSIWDANEAFYVETPREMLQRGDYISPTFNYEPRLNKPVLSYWIVAGFYHLFGVSVAVQRIPIAIGAVVLILTAFLLARTADDTPDAPRLLGFPMAAWWAGLGLAIAPRLLMFARRIFIDVYISMFLGLTLLFFALAERYPGRRRLFLVLMYVSVGLGLLTKGPVAAVLPGLVFALYLLLHRELARVKDMLIPTGSAIVLALVVPYYAALYQRHGWGPITSFLLGENVARFTDGVGVDRVRGIDYYLPVVFTDSFPWSLLLIGAAALWFTDRRRLRAAAAPPDAAAFRIRSLLWLWILAIVGFFTLSEAKQDLYIFPIVPAVAALGGIFISRALAPGGPWGWLRGTTLVMGLLVLAFGAGTFYIFQSAGHIYALEGAALVGALSAAGGAVVMTLAGLGRLQAALIAVAVTALALNWTFVTIVLPSFERYKPVPALSAVIAGRAGPDDAVVHYNVALPSMVYYLGRHVDVLFTPDPLFAHLRGPRTVYAVLPDDDYDRLAPQMGVETCVIARSPTVNVKLRAVLAREPLPEVLLITNRCDGR